MGSKEKQFRIYKIFEYKRILSILLQNKSYYTCNNEKDFLRWMVTIHSIGHTDRLDIQIDSTLIKNSTVLLKDMFDLSPEVALEFIRMLYMDMSDELSLLSFDSAVKRLEFLIHELENSPDAF